MKKRLLVLIPLAAIAAAGWQFRDHFSKDAAEIKLYGNVDIRGVDLGFRVSGKLLESLKDEGDSVKSGEILARIDRQPYEHELARADAELAAAAADQQMKKSGYRSEEIAAADARVAQAAAARATAALRLADTELKSPADGVVLTRTLEPGSVVQAGATVISLSLENPVWVRAYVHERELGKLPPGTKVLLTTDGRPKNPFHGKVGFVSPRAEFTPKSVETPELRTSLVYRIRIVVSDSDGSLRQGMPVTVSLDPTPR